MEKPLLDITTHVPIEHIDKRVADYFTPAGTWDWEFLKQYLPHEVLLHLAAYAINDDPNEKDEVIWSKSSTGKFTTKSAFLMLSPTESSQSDPLLKAIWKLQLPHRIQSFTWLALQNKLLTNEERQRQHLIDYTQCAGCLSSSESMIHVLRNCVHSATVWRELGASNVLPNFFSCQIEDWWQLNLKCGTKGDTDIQWNLIFCCTTWFLWKWRNFRIFRNANEIPTNKGVAIKKILEACKKNWTPDALIRGNQHNLLQVSWKKPPYGCVTLNVDGACEPFSKIIRTGGVIRDHDGLWQIGFTRNIGKGNPLLAEAWAMLSGVQAALSRNFRNVIIEPDSLELVELINNPQATDACHPIWNFLCCIHKELRCFSQVRVRHIFREANGVADILAKKAISSVAGLVFLSQPPDILQLLRNDLLQMTIPRIGCVPPLT